jgi:hypothetical protein
MSPTIEWDWYEYDYGESFSDHLSPPLASLANDCSNEVIKVLIIYSSMCWVRSNSIVILLTGLSGYQFYFGAVSVKCSNACFREGKSISRVTFD